MSHATVRMNEIAMTVSQVGVFMIRVRWMSMIVCMHVGMRVAVTIMGMKMEISVALKK